ncbi:interferon-activable protein 203-like [Apodemus sylvaticus]|uniref:interferon-activable protein 203-like n=1 Tax=Apodemus sylvaticus TaxID=10129 RepID=UPI0022424373|nr:interferon-activable protein 203-like [Apodemus sylvaticus]XP_052056422.1 interferon-activable protein 203-like [Apodemus sylvaticus]
MANQYKRIVLYKGLTPINDDHFRLFKSLMASDLRLERSMQEQYTRVQIADMMEEEFPDDAGLSKLIKFCEDLQALRRHAGILKKERSEAIGETSLEINRQEAVPARATSTTKHMNKSLLQSERGETSKTQAMTFTAQEESATAQKKRKQITKTEGGKKNKLEEQAQLPETSGTNTKRDEDCVQTPLKPPPTPPSSSSNKVPVATPSSVPNSLTVPPVSMSIEISRGKTTQIHPGTGSICVQALHVPPSTVSRSVCSTQLTQGAASCTRKDLSLPKVTSSRNVQASQLSSATASSSILVPYAISSTASSSLLAPHATPSTATINLALQLSPATASRALHAASGLSATVYSSPTRTPRKEIVPTEPTKEEGHQKGPKQVMVLKVTEPFTYDMKEDKRMFHATVATETEFFRVKVFDTALKSKFIPGKIIAISNYFGCHGFLEIYRASCVSDVDDNGTMVISKTLRQRANATPRIFYLFSLPKGTFVNGEFVVFRKTERNNCIYYGIKDDTAKIVVVVNGRLTNIRCEPGSKLRLVCFELTSTKDNWQLRSVSHSYMQVISGRM